MELEAKTGKDPRREVKAMNQPVYQANCDLVLEMEEAGVGVEEILQYARGILDDAEIGQLIRGLQSIRGDGDRERATENSETARPGRERDALLEPMNELREYVLV